MSLIDCYDTHAGTDPLMMNNLTKADDDEDDQPCL